MENKLDREFIARNLMNILDAKNCTNYTIFMNDDLYNTLLKYATKVFGISKEAIEETEIFLNDCKEIIKKIENDSPISIDEKNKLFVGLVNLKRKYILK